MSRRNQLETKSTFHTIRERSPLLTVVIDIFGAALFFFILLQSVDFFFVKAFVVLVFV